nr:MULTISPECIES: hypothetical protein [Shewanella]
MGMQILCFAEHLPQVIGEYQLRRQQSIQQIDIRIQHGTMQLAFQLLNL